MYPFLRLIKEVFKFRKAPQLGFGDVHISHHMCMPWDLDPWVELNNGRTLTLYMIWGASHLLRAPVY